MNKKTVEIPEGKYFRDNEEKKALETYKVFCESMQSLNKKTKKCVPVTVLGVAYLEHQSTPDMKICASCQYLDTDWQILVPASEMGFDIKDEDKMSDYNKERMYRSYIRNMQLSTIDIVAQGIVLDKKLVGASRKMAMKSKVMQNYFKSDKNGKSRMERSFELKKPIEARVITVAKSQVFVDVFGNILPVFARDVEHRFIKDLNDVIHVGEVVPVMITKLAIDKENELIDMAVSIKDAKENNTLKNIRNYTVNSEWVGKITGIKNGYFVQIGSINNGIDVFCKYVRCVDMPDVGDYVNIVLRIIDKDNGRAMGEILEIKKKAALVA